MDRPRAAAEDCAVLQTPRGETLDIWQAVVAVRDLAVAQGVEDALRCRLPPWTGANLDGLRDRIRKFGRVLCTICLVPIAIKKRRE